MSAQARQVFFYAQITYFICIKRSSLHSLNLPNSLNSLNSLNSCKSCQICLSRVWRVRAKWLANVGRMYQVRAKQGGQCQRMYRVRPIFQNGHFGEYSNSPKMANFWRVLEFDKFAGEWPLLKKTSSLTQKRHFLIHFFSPNVSASSAQLEELCKITFEVFTIISLSPPKKQF